VGIVGLGKIALEEHIPALTANDAFTFVAAVSTKSSLSHVPVFATVEAMLDTMPEIGAVAICTPPQAHYGPAMTALSRGKHVLMEKPPCPTLAEFDGLCALARSQEVTLFQTWHAREAPAIAAAADWLSAHKVTGGHVVWKEDVRHWHPGQSWIWNEGGFGVLDAGINAISILTAIVPEPISVDAAHLFVPESSASPIAAAVVLRTASGAVIDAEFDFRHRGIQSRLVEIETADGPLDLTRFSAARGMTEIWGEAGSQSQEYAALYRRFAALIKAGGSDTDKRPLELVIEILRVAGRSTVAAFRD
jgi:D-galactose 1-dehydrogenase